MFAEQALDRFLQYSWDVCLDIGAGSGEHSKVMRSAGRKAVTIDSGHAAVLQQDYMAHHFTYKFGAVWCSHVLEHQVNPGVFLQKIHSDVIDGGVVAITVPPAKHEIVGGHVTLWNAGLLLYQMILAGFDCRYASVGTYGYNISVIVEKSTICLPSLTNDNGDIERLAEWFPLPVKHGFNGQLQNIRW